MTTVGFLHTAAVHAPAFAALLADVDPGAEDLHLVDAQLLADARERGVDAQLRARLLLRLHELADERPGIIVCTCSTLGGVAEALADRLGTPVLRLDRPMAERAAAIAGGGGRVVLVAAVAATLAPTRELLEQCVIAADSGAVIVDAPCLDAWRLFERGDHAAYHERVAAHVRAVAPDADVVVLAQASMAPAAELLEGLAVPVLSSPRLGVERAVNLASAAPGGGEQAHDPRAGEA